jgi:hypothetical protein
VKLVFGSWLHRVLRGGQRLAPIEQQLLLAFREHLPPLFHAALDVQLQALNLAQRQAEWRGICLYRLRWGKVFREDLPPLPCKTGEVKLLSMRIVAHGATEPIHVVFWAVQRVFFGFGTGESLRPVQSAPSIEVLEVKHSWRSNVEAAA